MGGNLAHLAPHPFPCRELTSRVYLRHGSPSTPVTLYLWLNPPSIARICPVTKFDAVRKYTTASATSAGVPPRCAGVFSIIRLPRSSISSRGIRSEERRVGKEWRSLWWPYHQ